MAFRNLKIFNLYKSLTKNGVAFIFIGILAVVGILTGGNSIQPSNLVNILMQTTTTGLMAIGMTLVIIDRGIDLSVGGVAALSSAIGVTFMTKLNVPWIICVLLMLFIGILIGFINGVSISFFKMPPFICTMAMMKMSQGLAQFILGGKTIFGLPQAHTIFGQADLLDIPVPVWILALFTAIGAVFLKYSRFGRELYAMGGNPKGAWMAGINVNKNRILIYTISGFMSAVAALIITSRIMCAQISIGEGSELDAIASAVIGGVSMAGGEGSVVGAVIGALIIVMINNGLNLLGVSPYIQTAVKGLVIFAAILADLLRRRKQLKNA